MDTSKWPHPNDPEAPHTVEEITDWIHSQKGQVDRESILKTTATWVGWRVIPFLVTDFGARIAYDHEFFPTLDVSEFAFFILGSGAAWLGARVAGFFILPHINEEKSDLKREIETYASRFRADDLNKNP